MELFMKTKIASSIILLTILLIATKAFSAQFLFTPRTSATEEYTDNLFLTKDDKEDDFITTVSAGFTTELLSQTSGLSLSCDPGYVFYQDFDENNTWELPASFRAWTQPGRSTRFEISDDFIRTTDPVSQDLIEAQDGRVEEIGDTTVRRGRQPYYANTARFNFSHQFGEEDRVYAAFVYGLLRNDDPQVEDNDYYSPSAGLDYWFTQRFGSQFFGEYTRGEYDQQSDFVGEPSSNFDNWLGWTRFSGRITRQFSLFAQYDQIYRHFTSGDENDYLVYAPSAGFAYDFSEDMYLRLGLGYYWQDIENEENQEDPFINGEISKTWNFQRGFINLTGLSGLEQNDFGAETIGFEQYAAIQGSARYDFTRRLFGDIIAYYRYSFIPSETDEEDEEDEDRNRYQAGAGLNFLPFRWMTLRLGYEFNKVDTTTDDDYTENRGLFTITLQPDQPWRF
jgi:opacity protein-like surface antigen